MPHDGRPSRKEAELLALVFVERSGREIALRYKRASGHDISYGTLYTTLRRMVEAGWVCVRDEDKADRRVRYFKITGTGAAVWNRLTRDHARFATLAEDKP